MQFSIFAILIGSLILSNQTPSTIQESLGRDEVKSILRSAISESAAQAANSFAVTDKTIEALKSAGVPTSVLTRLESSPIKGREIEGEKNFLEVVSNAIGKEDTETYKGVILSHTRGYLVVTEDFLNHVESLVLKTVGPDKDVKEWLRRNFRKFLANYISYTKQQSDVRNRITLGTQRLNEYLQQAKCAELECDGVPPCCGKLCDPCKQQ